jgi:carbamoyl-phosphate synthase large subunit
MTIRVAITGVSGDVGHGTCFGLRQGLPGDEPIWLLGLDAYAQPDNVSFLDSLVNVPLVKDPNYVDAVAEALRAHEIDVLLPGIDSEIPILSARRLQLMASGTKVVLAPQEVVEAAADKLLTAEYLSARGIRVPVTCDAGSPADIDFPIVAKPRRGHGSRGIMVLADEAELRTFLATQPRDYCLQRQVHGPEITVGFLYNADGVMCDAIAMERTLEFGRTVRAKVVDSRETLRFMEDFGARIPGQGAINAQLRWDKRYGPTVFELNARLSGSTDMRVAVGFNDPLRLARHFGRGEPIVPARPRRTTVHRSGTQLRLDPC